MINSIFIINTILCFRGGIRGDHTSCLKKTDPIKDKNTIVFGDTVGDLHNPVKIVKHDLVVSKPFLSRIGASRNPSRGGSSPLRDSTQWRIWREHEG